MTFATGKSSLRIEPALLVLPYDLGLCKTKCKCEDEETSSEGLASLDRACRGCCPSHQFVAQILLRLSWSRYNVVCSNICAGTNSSRCMLDDWTRRVMIPSCCFKC